MKLYIRTTKTVGQVPLYTRMRIGERSFWINLHLPVLAEKWTEISRSPRRLENFLDKSGYGKLLSEMEFGIRDLKRKRKLNLTDVETLVEDIALRKGREKLKETETLGRECRERNRNSPRAYVQNFVDRIERGEVRTLHGERFSKGSLATWKQFRRIFLEFCDKRPFTWDEISETVVGGFLSRLERCDYMKTVRNKYLKMFKQVVTDAEKLGLHSNSRAKSFFKRLTVKESDKAREIYLTVDELDALYHMKLEGFEERVRDLFLIGVYTAQRFSDYSVIREHCVGETSHGVKVIRIEQEKTDNPVVVPILDEKLLDLLAKYRYRRAPHHRPEHEPHHQTNLPKTFYHHSHSCCQGTDAIEETRKTGGRKRNADFRTR